MRSCIHLFQGQEKFERSGILTIAEKHTVWPVTGGLLTEIWCPYHQDILEHILTNIERQHKLLTSHFVYNRMSIPPEHQDMIT